MSTTLGSAAVTTPIGTLCLATSSDARLVAMGFEEQWTHLLVRLEARFGRVTLAHTSGTDRLAARVRDYFEGDVHAIESIEVDLGGSTFQRRVWSALQTIPVGSTRSYSSIAREIGSPGAVRAVGAANALNPVSIVVPCHRVIGRDGTLHGYAGGIERKRWLLEHERAFPTSRPATTTSRDVVARGACLSD